MRTLLRFSPCFLAAAGLLCAQDNSSNAAQDADLGARLFQTHCSYCHGTHGEGGRGADLTTGQYRHGGSNDELFRTIRNGIPGSEMPAVRATDNDVWQMVAFVKKIGSAGLEEKARGDSVAGKSVYASKGCASCHAIGNDGGNLGPELTDVGRRRGPQFLQESILKPEADVPIRYRAIQVITKSGQTVSGIRLNEDDLSIQLRDTSDNLRSFLKDNLRDIRRDHPSLMPAYGPMLTNKELENLIAYLSSLRGEQ